MIKTIIKRDGTQEAFDANKVNQWGAWAAQINHTDWSAIVLHAVSILPETCTSKALQDELVKTCVDKCTWEYALMAGRLYIAGIYKEFYPQGIPTIKQLHDRLLSVGLMVELGYSQSDYDYLQSIINHDKDLQSTQFEIKQIRYKYALRDKINRLEYETPQFMYMRMAMALCEKRPLENRLQEVVAFYTEFSNKVLNAPTPYMNNLGTVHNGYSSCCLYTTNDTWQSLAAGDHIAYSMTVQSAGIGAHIKTRSLGDGVRNGLITHQGKLPYYRSLVGSLGANLQNGRGGAATIHYTAFDPEQPTITHCRNNRTPIAKRIETSDLSFGSNRFFARQVALNKPVARFSYQDAPELFEAQYSKDPFLFESLYNEFVENNASLEKVPARQILLDAANEAYETGRHYMHMTDQMNKHTPFKEPIYSSNLCVAGDTKILTDKGYIQIDTLVDKSVNVWNGEEFSEVIVRQTGVNQRLIAISIDSGHTLTCTHYHKMVIFDGVNESKVPASEVNIGDVVRCVQHDISPITKNVVEVVAVVAKIQSIIDEGRTGDTFCFTEPKRGMGVFNGILTGNCHEVALPTKAYKSVEDLYKPYDETHGEIALCNLASINVANIIDDAHYKKVAKLALLMIDIGIHKNSYVFKSLEHTAKSRMNAGVGILGLAHLMAKNGLRYDTQNGRDFIHTLFETHAWHLYNGSLELGKELGNAPWIHKTLLPDGWTPLKTYERAVDSLTTVENKRDWQSLEKAIIENKGIRNSVVACFMPCESSSNAVGTPNGVYPIRDVALLKPTDSLELKWVAPDSTNLKWDYQNAYDISTKDMIYCYAIMQKWTDQSISADFYETLAGDAKVSTSDMIDNYLTMVKYGLKTKYYQNTRTANAVNLNSSEGKGCAGGACDV